jgi:hypothetical protein
LQADSPQLHIERACVYLFVEGFAMSIDTTVVVATFGFRHEAEFAKATLDSAGIASVLSIDDAGGAEAGLSFANPARIIVRSEDHDTARDVLRQFGFTL